MVTTLLDKSSGRFLVLDLWKPSNRRIVFNFGDNITGYQNQVCFERLIRFSKLSCIFMKFSTPRNWHPYSISAMFHGNRASSYETWPVNFDRPWHLTGSISPGSHDKYDLSSTMAWSGEFSGRYEGCSHWSNFLYPWKNSARYPRQVGPIGRTLRASKNVPLSISILSVSSDDMPMETLPS